MGGRLLGIARRERPRAPMEVIEHGRIIPGQGVVGDFRGALKSGRNKREISILARADWEAALRELGQHVSWEMRRANLYVDGIFLPRSPGSRIRLSGGALLEVTGECDPCNRMNEIAEGLRAVLTPDWRGGVLTRVIEGGPIMVGDSVEVEE
ncbi:MOSC domain-containing protein [Sphingomonas ginkgonis]|uniref:MOSC domain-containing protein n=1 Tax=Sphingomonas ginkgonis TaxID=2315330 RepID=A0A429VAR7_9SPHN|nr:MOSC domain-containing protein [Sphingomonas ginkgonis]RST30932.1 MOSC domain-containing protein [Sphingomonas ginkgonis]